MWKQVGILRSGKELRAVLEALLGFQIVPNKKEDRAERELRNLHSLALLVARSALAREESRGSHYRSDFPYKHSLVTKGRDVTFAN
jgi:L-aspartate oxidase